jgi:hypothetical protein
MKALFSPIKIMRFSITTKQLHKSSDSSTAQKRKSRISKLKYKASTSTWPALTKPMEQKTTSPSS